MTLLVQNHSSSQRTAGVEKLSQRVGLKIVLKLCNVNWYTSFTTSSSGHFWVKVMSVNLEIKGILLLIKMLFSPGSSFLFDRRAPSYSLRSFLAAFPFPQDMSMRKSAWEQPLLIWCRFSCLTSWRPSFYFTLIFQLVTLMVNPRL